MALTCLMLLLHHIAPTHHHPLILTRWTSKLKSHWSHNTKSTFTYTTSSPYLPHQISPLPLSNIILPLLNTFHLTNSYFSSSFACRTQFTPYYSPHQRDQLIGFLGPTFSHQWLGNGYAHIPNTHLLPCVLKWAKISSQLHPNSLIILTLSHEDWFQNPPNFLKHDNIQHLMAIPPLTIQ